MEKIRRAPIFVDGARVKTLICAICNQQYQLVSADWIDKSEEQQKKYYDMTVKFRQMDGLEILPFEPVHLDYKHAPDVPPIFSSTSI
jgi:hypothetical protein